MRSNTLRIEPFYSNDFLPLNKSSSSSGLAPSTSAIFPYLRKGESSDAFPSSKQKNPLLTLKLSSPSFLDSTVSDGLSDNALYTVKTTSTCTTVLRNDPWEGTNKVADIRWAKKSAMKGKSRDSLQGSVVEMIGSGRTKPVEQFLKFSALSGYVAHICLSVTRHSRRPTSELAVSFCPAILILSNGGAVGRHTMCV